ncbi:MAG: MOSC domain-containing protein [Flaviflexus sp.]|uniref:MOSC domain-containing protein n=1 Tax=Flaviflexus sp. TaxID=1969482 RepID=UPI00352F4FDC
MRVTHLCVVSELVPVPLGRVGVTAINKKPVDGPIRIVTMGLWGDIQADRAKHGGIEKAVYAVSAGEMAWWERELGEELPPGIFGENIRVEADVDDFILGARYRLGTAELEVTGCRNPCKTFEYWRGEQGWVKRFLDHGYSGAYFRVRKAGEAQAGDELVELHVPHHGVTVKDLFTDRASHYDTLAEAHRSGDVTLADYVINYLPENLRNTL